MKKKNTVVWFSSLALMVAAGAGVSAQSHKGQPQAADGAPEAVVYDAASAMAFLTAADGDWNDTESNYDIGGTVTIETKAAGSAVFFKYEQGKATEMETVFHMDGPETLMLTHYCAAQNAPILQFETSDKPGELRFRFVGGTNLDPSVDGHFHDQTFQIIDANTIEQRTIVWQDGAPASELIAVLHRQPGTSD